MQAFPHFQNTIDNANATRHTDAITPSRIVERALRVTTSTSCTTACHHARPFARTLEIHTGIGFPGVRRSGDGGGLSCGQQHHWSIADTRAASRVGSRVIAEPRFSTSQKNFEKNPKKVPMWTSKHEFLENLRHPRPVGHLVPSTSPTIHHRREHTIQTGKCCTLNTFTSTR